MFMNNTVVPTPHENCTKLYLMTELTNPIVNISLSISNNPGQ